MAARSVALIKLEAIEAIESDLTAAMGSTAAAAVTAYDAPATGGPYARAGGAWVGVEADLDFSMGNRYRYGGAGGVATEGVITAAGRALLDDASAEAQLVTLGAEPTQVPVTQAASEAGVETAVRSWSVVRVWQAIAAKVVAMLTAGVSLLINEHQQTPIRLYITAGVLGTIELGKGPYYCKVNEPITVVNLTAAATGTVGNSVVYFHHDGSASYAVAMPSVLFPNKVSGAFTTSPLLTHRADFCTVPVPDAAWTVEGRVVALGAI